MTKQPSSLEPANPNSFFTETSWRDLLSIDIRALAVLRIAVAVLLIVDLADRIPLFEFFYGTEGFLNDGVGRLLTPAADGFWSLYWISENPIFTGGLMVLTAVAAVGLLLGWRSRTMAVLCLVLFWSLNVRNPMVTTAGHILLRLLLFWMVWLPVGATWSLDTVRRRSKDMQDSSAQRTAVFSMASIGVMVQVASMYLFSGIAKWNEDWLNGTALEKALHLDMYVKPFGHFLDEYPALTATVTLVTLLFEIIGPLMLFMPYANRYWRVFFFIFFAGMHIGIWMAMSIGIFSAVAIVSWAVFLPREIWRISPKQASTETDVQSPEQSAPELVSSRSSVRGLPVWGNLICGLFVIYTIAINAANINPQKSSRWFPGPLRFVGNVAMMTQEFKMFARPWPDTIWFELTAVKANSPVNGYMYTSLIDPRGDNVHSSRPNPDQIFAQTRSQHFRRLLFALALLKPRPEPEGEEDEKLIAKVREKFARRWINLIESELDADNEWLKAAERDASAPIRFQLICWRRKISLEFPDQKPRSEIWAQFKQ